MTLRKHLLGSRPFASIGASLDINLWDSRLQKIHAELLTDVPCLTELKASSLDLQFKPTTHGVDLIVLIAESPQFQLQHLSGDDDDLDMQDIKRVRQDQGSIEDRITLAISGTANPSDEPEVARIRQRLRVPRNSNGVTIWSSPTAKILPLFELPKVLPLGGQRPLPVRVTKLTRL